ncbi:peptide deformylase [Nocardia gipuzkoensis]|uniref:peptide deformylase n=1 Tax=Nocardia gipuzkoensis TaxID=2749991 RepID=UPI001E4A109A|nr:peptide deformylase [Nocardia gipuzkoensis]UGT72402.1 peptide deformylase [Nocardia gipuzkoensis]
MLIQSPGQAIPLTYAACSCGRRFPLSVSQRATLRRQVVARRWELIDGALTGARLATELIDNRWPSTAQSAWAKQGVVPVGYPAIHCATTPVGELTELVEEFGEHLRRIMRQASGIGLAANQVGVRVRALAHALPQIAPDVLVNPELISRGGCWEYREGCLSLQVEGSSATVVRPRRILLRAWTPSGDLVVIAASELLARVLQHELDHLDGIEYVQRLVGDEHDRVYRLLEKEGIDTSVMPALSDLPTG